MFSQTSENINILKNNFNFTEASINLRFAYKEKFIQSADYRYSMGTTYPIVYLNFTRGLKGFNLGDFDYNKIDISFEKDFPIKQLGISSLRASAGYIDSDVPYTKLYNGIGSFENFSLFAPFTFNTMRMNEFLSDKYLAFFYQHNFGKLLFKTKKFQPEIVISTNYGLGSLANTTSHRNIDFSTMSKGYLESGIVINDILRTGFYGLGVGTFYRYGHYALPVLKDNFALKLSLKITL